MIDVTPNQPFDSSFPWPELDALYRNVMDGAFLDTSGPAREITLHLTPVRLRASGITTAPVPNRRPIQYNPFVGRAPRPAPINVSTTRTPGVRHIARDVTYLAQIRHGARPEELEEVGIELQTNQVATTTIIESQAHINEAENATIDGKRYQKHAGPKPIGFKTVRYLITVWEEIPEGQSES
jgi:hypothetical protein